MTRTLILAAAASLALGACATNDYGYRDSRGERAVKGAVIGGAGGAVAGELISGDPLVGAVIGGAAGAAIGAASGRDDRGEYWERDGRRVYRDRDGREYYYDNRGRRRYM